MTQSKERTKNSRKPQTPQVTVTDGPTEEPTSASEHESNPQSQMLELAEIMLKNTSPTAMLEMFGSIDISSPTKGTLGAELSATLTQARRLLTAKADLAELLAEYAKHNYKSGNKLFEQRSSVHIS